MWSLLLKQFKRVNENGYYFEEYVYNKLSSKLKKVDKLYRKNRCS